MNMIHPAENILQQYAADKLDCSLATVEHIQSCMHCMAEVESYQLLFSQIKKISKPVFDFDLESMVIPQLPEPRRALSADRFIAGFLILFICSCIGIPVFLFWTYIQNIFSGISTFFLYAIIISATVIFIIKALDMYNLFRKQMQVINFQDAF